MHHMGQSSDSDEPVKTGTFLANWLKAARCHQLPAQNVF